MNFINSQKPFLLLADKLENLNTLVEHNKDLIENSHAYKLLMLDCNNFMHKLEVYDTMLHEIIVEKTMKTPINSYNDEDKKVENINDFNEDEYVRELAVKEYEKEEPKEENKIIYPDINEIQKPLENNNIIRIDNPFEEMAKNNYNPFEDKDEDDAPSYGIVQNKDNNKEKQIKLSKGQRSRRNKQLRKKLEWIVGGEVNAPINKYNNFKGWKQTPGGDN